MAQQLECPTQINLSRYFVGIKVREEKEEKKRGGKCRSILVFWKPHLNDHHELYLDEKACRPARLPKKYIHSQLSHNISIIH